MASVLSSRSLLKTKSHGVHRPFILASKLSTTENRNTTAETSKNPLFDPNLSALKRGTGGRSSFNGMIATVFGATGLTGGRICNKLGKAGTQIIVPYKGTSYDVIDLKLCGDLGQVLFFPYHLKDEESVRKAMYRSNVVINLVAREWDTKNFSLDEVHVAGARRIARLARECGVKRLIHFSALNATEHPKPIILKEGSKFYATKWRGEMAVKEQFPDVTILRPSDIWGQADRFLHFYSTFWRRTYQAVSIWGKGEGVEKQPVYSGDVAQAVMNAIKDPDTMGKTYDIVGPHRYHLPDLVNYIFTVLRRTIPKYSPHYRIRDLKYDFRMRAFTSLTTHSPRWPLGFCTWERMEREVTTDVLTGNPTLEDLGITPIALEDRIEFELKPFRNFNYYMEEVGEFPPAPHPKLVVPIEDD